MDFKARILPTRDQLIQTNKNTAVENCDVSAIEMMLNLLNTSAMIKDYIDNKLKNNHNISDGRMILLLSLKGKHPESVSMGDLSKAMGVSNATLSVMVKRMLKEANPLIKKQVSSIIRSSFEISLTDAGLDLIKEVLPDHFYNFQSVASLLNAQEQQTLLQLVKKLATFDVNK